MLNIEIESFFPCNGIRTHQLLCLDRLTHILFKSMCSIDDFPSPLRLKSEILPKKLVIRRERDLSDDDRNNKSFNKSNVNFFASFLKDIS